MFDSKSDMRNFVNFNARKRAYKNLHFDVLILSIPYKVSAKKIQNNDLALHLRMIQTLKKN